jgi:hypothetical protein
LKILPAPAAHTVLPTIAAEDEDDQTLPPLDLNYRLKCNCFPTFCNNHVCLSKFAVHQEQYSDQDVQSKLDRFADLLLDYEETVP